MRWLLALLYCTGCALSVELDADYGIDAGAPTAGSAAESDVMSKTTVLRPLGLISQPAKHGQYAPGALSRALNVCMRDPGIISSLPDVRSYRDDVISSGYTLRRLFPGDSNVLAIGDNAGTWAARWVTGSGSTAITTPTGYGSLAFDTGKASAAVTRGKTIYTPNLGPIVFDSEGSTTPRIAGFYMPGNARCVSVQSTNAQSLATGYVRRYRTLFRREQSDGYILVGPVSNAADVDNTSGSTIDPEIRLDFKGDIGLIAGDIVEIYRTDDIATGSDPGDTYRLARSYKLVSADISNTYAVVRDTSTSSTLGAELYTNPGQEKLENTNLAPPLADDVVVFKGHTFYASRRLPASLTFKMNNMVGTLSSTTQRIYGIGTRAVTGDISSGSPTVLNISNTNGVVIGQNIGGTGIPQDTRITNIVGTTVTMSANATATTVGLSISINDVIEFYSDIQYIAISDHNSIVGDFSTYEMITDVPVKTDVAAGPTLSFPEQQGATYTIRHKRYNDIASPFAIRATNGQNYSPTLPATTGTALTGSHDERFNRYHWSKADQPEAVPVLNYGFVGNGTLYRMIPTRDALYMFCSDGLYRLTGADGEWRVDPVDPRLILAARAAVDVLGDVIWAYTNRGLVAIAGDQVSEVASGVIGDLLPGAVYADTWDTFLACDELHREVWLTFRSGSNSVSYVYNTVTKAFVSVDDDEWSCMAYSRALQSLVLGAVSSNPDVLYFELDSSATRMPGAELRFQPLTGDGDPFTLKEFIELSYLFEGIGSAATLVPSFDGTNYTAATVPANALESQAVVAVPRNAPGVGRRIAPGFTLSAGGTAQRWSFRGMSLLWSLASEVSSR